MIEQAACCPLLQYLEFAEDILEEEGFYLCSITDHVYLEVRMAYKFPNPGQDLLHHKQVCQNLEANMLFFQHKSIVQEHRLLHMLPAFCHNTLQDKILSSINFAKLKVPKYRHHQTKATWYNTYQNLYKRLLHNSTILAPHTDSRIP